VSVSVVVLLSVSVAFPLLFSVCDLHRFASLGLAWLCFVLFCFVLFFSVCCSSSYLFSLVQFSRSRIKASEYPLQLQ